MHPTYLIDFDSTFTKVEALDELASIVLKDHKDKQGIEMQISEITDRAMSGILPFDTALKQRLSLLKINREHLDQLITILKTKVSDSFIQNQQFLNEHSNHTYIISGGFKEFIVPIVKTFGIHEDHVFANEFIFDTNDQVIGYDEHNFLSQSQGKVKLVASLNLQGEVIVIGDGFTDYEIKEAGLASKFYLFTENIKRAHLVDKADKVIARLNEIL